MNLLTANNLHVSYKSVAGLVPAVRGITFDLFEGETVGLVGESGCGKSTVAHALMGLLDETQVRMEGEILLHGKNLINLSENDWCNIRGRDIGMIFQDPMSALNPTMRVGSQISEALRKHQRLSKSQAKKQTIDLLQRVGITDAGRRYDQYAHEFSGGMRQRALIAMAVACRPKLLIADEPTTALDVTIQGQVLDLLQTLQKETNAAILLITHDLAVVARMCDRVLVMYAGQIVESGSAHEIFHAPQHPYTRGLLASIPRLNSTEPLVPIPGSPPNLLNPPVGCPFAARCPFAMQACVTSRPPLDRVGNTHRAACWLHDPRAAKQHARFAESA